MYMILCLTNGDEMAPEFLAELFQLYYDTFPVKKANCKSNCKPWIKKKTLCLINGCDKFLKEVFLQESWKLQNIVVSEISMTRKEHGAHVLNKLLHSNSKKFHKSIQDLMGKVSSSFSYLVVLVTQREQTNEYFASI